MAAGEPGVGARTTRTAAWVADAILAVAVWLTLSLVITADVDGSRPEAPAYLWAAGLGALMLVRRTFAPFAIALLVAFAFDLMIPAPPVGALSLIHI